MYCESCRLFTDDSICPQCSGEMRMPREDDECFLVEKEAIWGDMLEGILRDNGIPHYYVPMLGAGLSMKIGRYRDSYRFFVPYAFLQSARDIVDGVFAPVREEPTP